MLIEVAAKTKCYSVYLQIRMENSLVSIIIIIIRKRFLWCAGKKVGWQNNKK